MLLITMLFYFSVAVVVGFFICWAPFHTQRLMATYMTIDAGTKKLGVFMNTLYYISGTFYYISTTINPILYSILSLKFRQAFKNTIFRLCQNQPQKRPQKAFTTYKFNNKQGMQVDTRLTLLNGKVNVAPESRSTNLLKAPVVYMTSRGVTSRSSSHSGGSVRIQYEPPNDIELERILVEHKSLSFHEAQSDASSSNTCQSRPYHSFS